MNSIEQYFADRTNQLQKNKKDAKLIKDVFRFTPALIRTNFIKNFSWLGLPILQYPTDMFAIAELIWKLKPDIIIETGIAMGGSTVFYASMLEMIGGIGRVLAIDIDVRDHTHKALDKHPMAKRIIVNQSDSVADWVVAEAKAISTGMKTMVILDSNHTEEHVLAELKAYSPLVTVGSYIIVMDTDIETWADDLPDRPWGIGNNPMTAVKKFMKGNKEFIIDKDVETQTLITAASNGFLKRVK
jgi:cephalosporin hydroxylase